MKRLTFKCTLLSDIIINAQTATEGTQETLDFIPGSNFLGIVAKYYSSFSNSYDVFHSGKVRFGDAHLAKNDEKSFKSPLSWFINKGSKITETPIWIHHSSVLTAEKRNSLKIKIDNKEQDVQLKQVRSGWVLGDGSMLKAENNFAIKSAYNRDERRSQEGKMYGYKSLESDSEWIFFVDVDEAINETEIIEKLEGERNIGRSRSAQYGRVKIEKIDQKYESKSSKDLIDGKVVIYAESRLAFYDELGQPNLQPTEKDFNLPENYEICWDLSQVKHQIFAPYNGKNKSSEADRAVFQKGSVFVFKGSGEIDLTKIESGIGAYLNEGFGQVIVNPSFLKADSNGELSQFKLKETAKEAKEETASIKAIKENDASDAVFANWIKAQEKRKDDEKAIYDKVNNFSQKADESKKFNGITPSQWGQIRAIATTSKDIQELKDKLFKPVEGNHSQNRADSGFLEHGKTAEKWKDCKTILKQEIEKDSVTTDYIEKLAAQMQKKAKNKENKKNKGGEK